MRILYLAHRIPDAPNKGEKIRTFHQLQHLARRHEIHLACMVDDKADLERAKTLEKHYTSVDCTYQSRAKSLILAGLALFTRKPLSSASFYSMALNDRIARRIREHDFDAIVVSSSSMAGYVLNITGIPKIMDFVDVDSEKWLQYADLHVPPLSWIYRMEAKRLARREDEIARAFDHSILVSEREAQALRERTIASTISVIPNGIDTEYFSPDHGQTVLNELTMVFTGFMSYFPNIDGVTYFCDEILPLIQETVPNARFCIVGRNPTRQVKNLGKRPNVMVTGAVKDVRPYLAGAAVAVVPLRIARGLQNKVLEAMAMGLPVVTTPEVLQGIQAGESDGIRSAGSPREFADEVISLLKDPEFHRQCSVRARRYVESRHTWEDLGSDLDRIINESVTRRPLRATCA